RSSFVLSIDHSIRMSAIGERLASIPLLHQGEDFLPMNRSMHLLILASLFFDPFIAACLAQSARISTYAGSALPANGSQALTQAIGVPQAVSADGSGGFYVSSNQNRIYHVAADGTLTVVAGSASAGFGGDKGPASAAQFNYLQGIVADSAGN